MDFKNDCINHLRSIIIFYQNNKNILNQIQEDTNSHSSLNAHIAPLLEVHPGRLTETLRTICKKLVLQAAAQPNITNSSSWPNGDHYEDDDNLAQADHCSSSR